MGCCRCTNKTCVTTSGILALIQSGIGLIFNVYFLALYFGYEKVSPFHSLEADQEVLLVVTSTQISLIRGILITATLLHTTWLISSVAVLIGNSRDNINSLRQWIVVTIFIIVGDVVFPIVLVVYTIFLVVDAHVAYLGFFTAHENYFVSAESFDDVTSALRKYYILLLIAFCKLGPVSVITNICLCFFTHRRVGELIKPLSGHVVTSVPVSYGPGAVQVFPVTQQYGFPTPQQQGYPMSQTFRPLKPQPADTKSHDENF